MAKKVHLCVDSDYGKMCREREEPVWHYIPATIRYLKLQLAGANKEIERLKQEIKDYMKPNPLACGEVLQCNACQGYCECDCEVKKESK